ncbi:MAG TPA: hypothetical protein VGH43_00525 [Jatrophihabitans sp.]
MTTAVDPGLQRALRRAAVAATRAPSVLDTQPWRMVVRRESVEIHADRSHQLRHLDPDGRSLIFSCGSALTNVLLSLSADGLGTHITRFPEFNRPDLIAAVHIVPDDQPVLDPLSAALRVAAVDGVCTTPARSIGAPMAVVEGGAVLAVPPRLREIVECIVRESIDRVRADPSAHAEIRPAWLSAAMPTQQAAAIPSLGVVVDDRDAREGWLRAGERYQLMALDCALRGVSTIPVLPATAFPDLRTALRNVLGTTETPQLVFRAVAALPGPPRRRRRLVDTLVEGA